MAFENKELPILPPPIVPEDVPEMDEESKKKEQDDVRSRLYNWITPWTFEPKLWRNCPSIKCYTNEDNREFKKQWIWRRKDVHSWRSEESIPRRYGEEGSDSCLQKHFFQTKLTAVWFCSRVITHSSTTMFYTLHSLDLERVERINGITWKKVRKKVKRKRRRRKRRVNWAALSVTQVNRARMNLMKISLNCNSLHPSPWIWIELSLIRDRKVHSIISISSYFLQSSLFTVCQGDAVKRYSLFPMRWRTGAFHFTSGNGCAYRDKMIWKMTKRDENVFVTKCFHILSLLLKESKEKHLYCDWLQLNLIWLFMRE